MIEIDEVLVPTIASVLRPAQSVGEDLALDLFFLGGGLDHQIAIAEIVERLRRADALERGLALLFGDALAGDLAGKIAVDGGEPCVDAVGSISLSSTCKPASAQTCAMPLPI